MRINRVKKKSSFKSFGTLRNVAVLVSIFAVAIIVYVYLHKYPIKPLFSIKHVAFIGNEHLTDDELRVLAGVRPGSGLVSISCNEVGKHLLKSPWIKSVSLSRKFPDTLLIAIKEAEPFALLDKGGGHLFLIDEQGKLLEELRDNSVPFLPVIEGDPFKEKEGFSEALNLVKLMSAKGFLTSRDHIEVIAHKPQEVSLKMDETVVKMGAGEYEEKVEKLVQLEEEINKVGISVDYIDLRFADKAIVKPMTGKAAK